MSFHTQSFTKAAELVLLAKQSRNFKNLLPLDQERWLLYEAHIHLFISIGLLGEGLTAPKVSYKRLYNNLPLSQTDKRGLNVPLRIFDIIFDMYKKVHLFPKKEAILTQKIESLSKYRYRNLNVDNETFRTDTFIAMMELLPLNHYNSYKINQQSITYYENIENNPIDITNPTAFDIEVIPYEFLWKVVLYLLENN